MENIQYIAVVGVVFLALRFLYKKIFSKKKSNKSCGSGGCGC